MTIVELEYPKIERIEGDERYAKFACEPLPPGYGTTLGNSLRRVLLSSLPGAAITAARVRGVAHEFSTIPGVKEDVVQIVLNLKLIRLRSFSNEPVTLTIEKEGPGVATAGGHHHDQRDRDRESGGADRDTRARGVALDGAHGQHRTRLPLRRAA